MIWAVQTTFLPARASKPTGDAYIESLKGKFRTERLNQHWFLSIEDAQDKIRDYNETRPHGTLMGQASP